MPYAISKDFSFAAAHFIEGHPGKCRNLHGHNYRVRVTVKAGALDALGMVVDFADLKAAIDQIVDVYDHTVLNEVAPFDTVSPTAENISERVFRGLAECLDDDRVRVARVEIWENDRSCAIYEPEPVGG